MLSKSGLNQERKFIPEVPFLPKPSTSKPTVIEMEIDIIPQSESINRLQNLRDTFSPKVPQRSSAEISNLQKVTTTKDGKKRIQPVFQSTSTTLQNISMPVQLQSTLMHVTNFFQGMILKVYFTDDCFK